MTARALPPTLLVLLLAGPARAEPRPVAVSGRYPHLAMSNQQGECGVGAVVPFADRLWAMTYAPHMPKGSDDKLYEIDAALRMVPRPESVGGTPAGRLVHRESGQLVMGPYFIDRQRTVRVVPPGAMPGRLTAVARHLRDPAGKVYVYDMEGALWEVDVATLAPTRLFDKPVPGWHGKGAYTAQGRLVVANNGELPVGRGPRTYLAGAEPGGPDDAGALAQWDGERWDIVARRQFTEVTGPGGLDGAPADDAPLWSLGWDRRSLLLLVLDRGAWHTFRLPKADHSYDGTHGWHTEWPRIREVEPARAGRPARWLMNMHGGWFDFPPTFSAARARGLRPLGAHLKVTADFAPWNGRIVFACDDAARSGFKIDGGLDPRNDLVGRSNSNLWFATWEGLRRAGRPMGQGGPWLRDPVAANVPSDPYLFAGYERRVLHLAHGCDEPLAVTVEGAPAGGGPWRPLGRLAAPPRGYRYHLFPAGERAEWVRLVPDRACAEVTAWFHHGPGGGAGEDRRPFAALADVDAQGPWTAAVGLSEADEALRLAVLATPVSAAGSPGEARAYRVEADLTFSPLAAGDPGAERLRARATVVDPVIEVDEASVVVVEQGRRYRLPKTHPAYDRPFAAGWPRPVREVVTERALLNAHGTFYVLPRPSSGGVARLKPVATHGKRITDFLSWRGLLVLAGTRADAGPDGHHFRAAGAPVGLWFGDIDDLWRLGRPRGRGGPWLRTAVRAGEASDPYLMLGYDRKRVLLAHDAGVPVRITLEVDPVADGSWHVLRTFEVPPRRPVRHELPAGYSAHWLRARADTDCRATVQLVYD